MHERTERAIARLLFVFCCAVPTSLTLLAILITWTPWYHASRLAAIAEHLSRETGLVVQIEDFRRVSPNRWTLHRVELIEPETLYQVAMIRQIDWTQDADSVRVMIHQPELQSEQLGHAWSMIHDRLISRPEHTTIPIEIAANDVTIVSRTGDMPLRDVQAWVQPNATGLRMNLECRLADQSPRMVKSTSTSTNTSLTRVTLVRDRSGERPESTLILESGDNDLPCSAIAGYLPTLQGLGPNATFRGALECRMTDTGTSIVLDGSQFNQIDLSYWSKHLPYPVVGTADLQLARCTMRPGEPINVAGTLIARDGLVGIGMLGSLQRDLGFEIDMNALPPDGRGLPYRLAALKFSMLGDSQISLQGMCDTQLEFRGGPPGVALLRAEDGQPVVFSSGGAIKPHQLMATLGADRHYSPFWSEILMTPPRPIGMETLDPNAPPSGRLIPSIATQKEDVIKQR
ncbi:hypothetical protein [Stieleria varia]|uniref:Uncharacterized protein n=1 Tax=Stieleria varia TaxID=2528005 RepID=A0A5C6AGF1_9BACT|nr:hypothetical protein [Stieleria varia]TWT98689.1 hypothetical protein Pla52n_52060 [Stieleria varia]